MCWHIDQVLTFRCLEQHAPHPLSQSSHVSASLNHRLPCLPPEPRRARAPAWAPLRRKRPRAPPPPFTALLQQRLRAAPAQARWWPDNKRARVRAPAHAPPRRSGRRARLRHSCPCARPHRRRRRERPPHSRRRAPLRCSWRRTAPGALGALRPAGRRSMRWAQRRRRTRRALPRRSRRAQGGPPRARRRARAGRRRAPRPPSPGAR